MKVDIRIKDISGQITLVIRESTTIVAIPERMGQIFSEIIDFMNRNGIKPAGAPFAYWHNMNSEGISKGVLDMECGFPIEAPIEGEGQIKASKLPGGKVVTAMHIGPYETLHETYNIIQSWIEENGYEGEDNIWDTYLTNPREAQDESNWMTEISWPIKL